jgi:hypothetical protein
MSSRRILTVQDYLSGAGASYNSNDPFASTYAVIAARNKPPALTPPGSDDFAVLVESCLRARAVIYWKDKPGDCGSTSKVETPGAVTALKLGQAGVGTAGSLATLGIIGTAATIPLGIATLGLGLLIAPIIGIFQHHAQAVANEQETLCAMATQATPAIQQIDAFVKSGQVTPDQGIQAMQATVANLKGAISGIEKNDSSHCNAACYYHGVLDAHADFAKQYYPAIAPALAGTAPASPNNSAPASTGGVSFSFASLSAHPIFLIFAVLVVVAIIFWR